MLKLTSKGSWLHSGPHRPYLIVFSAYGGLDLFLPVEVMGVLPFALEGKVPRGMEDSSESEENKLLFCFLCGPLSLGSELTSEIDHRFS